MVLQPNIGISDTGKAPTHPILKRGANDGTPMNNATMPDQLAKGVPNVFPLTSARSMYEPFNHLKIGFAASYYDQMRSGVKFFAEQRGKKAMCAMYQDSDFGRDIMDGARDQLKVEHLSLVAETAHKPTDTDFSADVAKLHDANCDVILLGTIVRDTIQIVSAVRKIGWNVDLVSQVAAYDSAVAAAPGGLTEGLYTMTPILFAYPDDPRPAVRAFAAKYRSLFGHDPNFAAQVGYTGGQLMVLALQHAGKDLTADSFVAGMESIKDYQDIFGSPPMTFGPDKHQGSNQSFLTVVHDGRWVPVSTSPVGY
jgi:branched-chain amino acid transport system substrate-binding protein